NKHDHQAADDPDQCQPVPKLHRRQPSLAGRAAFNPGSFNRTTPSAAGPGAGVAPKYNIHVLPRTEPVARRNLLVMEDRSSHLAPPHPQPILTIKALEYKESSETKNQNLGRIRCSASSRGRARSPCWL